MTTRAAAAASAALPKSGDVPFDNLVERADAMDASQVEALMAEGVVRYDHLAQKGPMHLYVWQLLCRRKEIMAFVSGNDIEQSFSSYQAISSSVTLGQAQEVEQTPRNNGAFQIVKMMERIEKYDGSLSSKWQEWRTAFDGAREVLNVSDSEAKKAFPFVLAGAALSFAQRHQERRVNTILTELEKQFAPSQVIQSKVRLLEQVEFKQKRGMSGEEAFEIVVNEVNALSDQLGEPYYDITARASRINTIMLRSKYAVECSSVDCIDAAGIHKLREKCRAIDACASNNDSNGKAYGGSTFYNDGGPLQSEKSGARRKKNFPRRPRQDIVCNHCHKKGHVEARCFKKLGMQGIVGIIEDTLLEAGIDPEAYEEEDSNEQSDSYTETL